MTVAAVIVAAGRGTRAGGDVPKQWQQLAGKPMLEYSLDTLFAHPDINRIILVLHSDDMEQAEKYRRADVELVTGGADRATSVQRGLEKTEGAQYVLIHDVARPLVTHKTISDVIAALSETPGAAPALPVTDALWTGAGGRVTGTQDRSGLYRAQTPQGFHRNAIVAAHATVCTGQPADDVEVAGAFGLEVAIVPGDEDNLKITFANDFARAERILRGRDGH